MKYKIKTPADLLCGESLFPTSQMVSFQCILTWYKREGNSVGPFCLFDGAENLSQGLMQARQTLYY